MMIIRECNALLSMVLFFYISSCSGQIQCSGRQFVTRIAGGGVNYSPLPPGSGLVNSTYDPGVIGGWYSLAKGFVDVVRPGSLPYDQIRETLNSTGIQCSVGLRTDCSSSQGTLDVRTTLTSFATWWIGILILTIIGGIVGVAYCIGGMCFCCCRCCGKCGGSKKQLVTDYMDIKTFVYTAILSLLLIVLFVGVVLAFFSNQQTYESVNNAQTTLNNIFDHGVDYVEETVDELEELICQLAAQEGVAGLVIEEARNFNDTLQDLTTGIQSEVDAILNEVTVLTPGFNTTIEVLTNLTATTTNLRAAGDMLTAALNSIAMDIMSVQDDCDTATSGTCNLPSQSELQAGADFNQIPDVQPELDNIRSAIENINLQDNIQTGRDTFEGIIRDIEMQVSRNIDAGVDTLEGYNRTAFNLINGIIAQVDGYIGNTSTCPDGGLTAVFEGGFTLNVQFVRECVINAGFDFIQQYDVYRYAFGVVICSLALVTILLALIGIFMGMAGFRKDREPETRTGLSHCGGIFLLIGVCITFAFGFVLLLLCCVFFFFGSNAQKLCQAIESPDYPVYRELIDNTEFWGGSLLGNLLPIDSSNPNPEIFLSQILNNCEANQALFSAANLSLLLGSGNISQEINEQLNLTTIRQSVSSLLADAANDFNFTDTSFLPMDAQMALDDFRNASVDQINITSYREQIEAPLVNFNVTQSISDIMGVIDSLPVMGADMVRATLVGTITQLENIGDNLIPDLQAMVNQLDSEVSMLEEVTDTVVTNTSALVDNINAVISNITTNVLPNFLNENVNGAVDGVFLLIDSYLSHIDTQLSSNVGRCQPLWGIYDELYGTICRDFLQGLNGFWWSLGFCSLLFLPIIIFSVLASSYYLKKKTDNDDFEDYPMKSF